MGDNQQKRKGKEPIKVKYISNPIMVQASNEREFRAVVQELTGKTSDNPGPSVGRTANAARENRVSDHGNPNTVLGTEETTRSRDHLSLFITRLQVQCLTAISRTTRTPFEAANILLASTCDSTSKIRIPPSNPEHAAAAAATCTVWVPLKHVEARSRG